MLYMIKLHVLKEDRSMAFDKVLFVESQLTQGALVQILKWTKGIASFKVIGYSNIRGVYTPSEIISDKEFFENPIRFEKKIERRRKIFSYEPTGKSLSDFQDIEFTFDPCMTNDYTYIKIHNNSVFQINFEILQSKIKEICGICIHKCSCKDAYYCHGRYAIPGSNALFKAHVIEEIDVITKEYFFTIKDNMYNF